MKSCTVLGRSSLRTGKRNGSANTQTGIKKAISDDETQSDALVEEQWYHLNELHGMWREWDGGGNEEIIGDFYFGYPRQAFEGTANPDFNTLIKPYYGLEPNDFAVGIETLLPKLTGKTIRLNKLASKSLDLTKR